MKFTAVLAAAVGMIATVNGAKCPPGETLKLLGLAFEPSLPKCQEDSTYKFIPPDGVPTPEQVQLMCASTACPKTIAALQKLNPSDCDLTFTNGVTLNIKKLLDELVPACKTRIHLNAAPACPPGELEKLLSLAINPNVDQCEKDSTYSFLPPTTPTVDQAELLCASPACQQTLSALRALNPADCTQSFGSVSFNVKELLDGLPCARR